MILFGGQSPWAKLTEEERQTVRWHRTAIRGPADLEGCRACMGAGKDCSKCAGTGRVNCYRCAGGYCRCGCGHSHKCVDCAGTGSRRCGDCDGGRQPCRACRGDGAVEVLPAAEVHA